MENQSTLKTLEAELKLLRWQKLANESALKAAILKDKQTKRNDCLPQLLNGSNSLRLNSVIEDERSRDLIVDDSFVKKQREYERKNEEVARKSLLLQTERLRSIQKKAENIQMLRSRKQRCLQIKANTQHDDCTIGDEQNNSMSNAIIKQPLSNGILTTDENKSPSMLMRSQTLPSSMMKAHLQTPNMAWQQTKLQFTKLQSKSGPGEPSRPYYCVRVSQSESS